MEAERQEVAHELSVFGGGVLASDCRCWPSPGDFGVLRLVEAVFPTSDLQHPVTTPLALLIGQYLSQCPLRGRMDRAACCLTAQMLVDFNKKAARLPSEAVKKTELLLDHLVACLAEKAGVLETINEPLSIKVLSYSDDEGCDDEVFLAQLAHAVIKLCFDLTEILQETPSGDVLLKPIEEQLAKLTKLSSIFEQALSATKRAIAQVQSSRKPMRILDTEARPIPTSKPLFDEHFKWKSGDSKDEVKRLKKELSREKRGAIREIRKDAQFIADHRIKEKTKRQAQLRAERHRNFEMLAAEHGEKSRLERKYGMQKR